MATESRPCKGCGAAIVRTVRVAPIRHYCSDDCRPRCSVATCDSPARSKGLCPGHHQQLRRGEPLAPFTRQPQRGVCSVEGCGQPRRKTGWCAAHYQQALKTGKPPTPFKYKWSPTARACVVCGVSAPGRRRYCSDKCKAMFHRHGGARPAEVPCVVCDKRIDLLHELTRDGQRRRIDVKLCRRCSQDKRKHGTSVEALAQRDGVDCGICGAPVDMTLRTPELMRASVDHINPRARGGTNDPENLQLAHLWCNEVKSDRIEVASRVR